MPIYEYRCLECGSNYDLRLTVAERDKDIPCDYCGEGITRVPTSPRVWAPTRNGQ